jgi:hypothetical protein
VLQILKVLQKEFGMLVQKHELVISCTTDFISDFVSIKMEMHWSFQPQHVETNMTLSFPFWTNYRIYLLATKAYILMFQK